MPRFYLEGVTQILTRFPLKNSIFKKFEFLDPEIVVSRKIRSLGDVFNLFPKLVTGDIQGMDNKWL